MADKKEEIFIPEEWQENLTKQQIAMLFALKNNGANISGACKAVKIVRQTHYNWVDKVDTYKKAYDEISESLLDFVEGALLKNIKDGNVTAQIFYLKTRGKKRGYIERTEVVNKEVDEFEDMTEEEIEKELQEIETKKQLLKDED